MAKGVRFSITASDRTRAAFAGVQGNLRKTQGLQRSWNAGLNANRRAVQQFGFQMSDFAIQIAGGQSAMLAFTQQGGQMLQFFGPAGAIAAAFLAVFGSLAIAFTRSGKALSDLTPILGVLQEDFAAIGRGLAVVRELMIDFANVVINNIDRILITVATFAGFMAGRWVVAFVAARVATFTLVGALTALRGALIRTGIGALIVGAGELVYQFTRLVKGAGGFGNAMGLLRAVVVEAWGRMGEAVEAMRWRADAAWQGLKGSIYLMLNNIVANVVWFGDRVVGTFVGAYQAAVAVWEALPDAFRRIGAMAMNGLLGAMQSGLNGLTSVVNGLLTLGGKFPDLAIDPPDLSGFEATVPAAVDVAGRAGAAFNDAFNAEYLGGGLNTELLLRASEALNASGSSRDLADALTERLGRPMESLADLREALEDVDETGSDIDVRDWFGGSGAGDDAGSGGGSGSGSSVLDAMAEKAKEIKKMYEDMVSTVKSGLSSMFKSLFDETKSFADAARSALGTILDKVADMILDPIWDSLARTIANALIGSTGGGTSLLGGLFSGLLGFEGGGYTGQGSRSGGLDGKGGFMAMVHPNESIIDHTTAGGSSATGGASGTVVIRLADGLKAEMAGEMRGIAIETVDSKSAGIVSQAVSQSGQMSRATKQYGGI